MTLTEVRQTLAALELRPSKALGQNFLIDANILGIIVELADIRADETVLEIGAGLGVLTRELLARAKHVVAVEKDRRLCEYLRTRLPGLELIEGDAVRLLVSGFRFPAFATRQASAGKQVSGGKQPHLTLPEGFKVVANLPYSISTPVLQRLVEGEPKPRALVLLLQHEVGQRLAAQPRHKEYGALTLFTQLCYHVTIAHVVSRSCFYPAPGVDSAIVVLERRDPRVRLVAGAPFHDLVRQGFSQRRKMLRKLVPGAERVLEALGATATARAEELSLDQWIGLVNAVAKTAS